MKTTLPLPSPTQPTPPPTSAAHSIVLGLRTAGIKRIKSTQEAIDFASQTFQTLFTSHTWRALL